MKVYRLTLMFILLVGLTGVLGLFAWGWYHQGLEIPNVVYSATLGALGTMMGAVIRNNGGPPTGGAPTLL